MYRLPSQVEPAPPPEPKPKPKPTTPRGQRLRGLARTLASFGVGFLLALGALFAYNWINPGPPQVTEADVKQLVARAMASATAPPPHAVGVYEAIQPALVRIDSRFLGVGGKAEEGIGTGVIIDQGGNIITSLHVVQNAINIQVTFADGSQSDAAIAGTQPENDIAVLHPSQPPAMVIPAVLGNPRALRVGDEAIAVGNPLGLYNSLTAGSISGLNRSFKPPNRDTRMTGLIQFDAAVNPGNSGGPLLNSAGEVVGIVTGLLNPTEQNVFIGIGFAVPIDVAASAAGPPPY